MDLLVRMNRDRQTLVPDFRTEQPRHQQPRYLASQDRTTSSKTANSPCVKLSWSAGGTAPSKKCSDVITSWPVSFRCRNSGEERRGQTWERVWICGGQGWAALVSGAANF